MKTQALILEMKSVTNAKRQLLNSGSTSSHIRVESQGRETVLKLTFCKTLPMVKQNQT